MARPVVILITLAVISCAMVACGSEAPGPAVAPDAKADATHETAVDAPNEILDAPPAAPDITLVPVAPAPCPPLMALVDGTFCVDRYEAALQEQEPGGAWKAASPYDTVGPRTVRAVPAEGTIPQGYISGVQAAVACDAAGKRLCSSAEWLAACRGPSSSVWPYGEDHQSSACNDDYPGHPVVDLFGTSTGIWDAEHMNDPGINQQSGTVAAGGAHPGCVGHWGIYDMHGNLHEWVSDPSGTFRGGFYADAKVNGAGCLYVTTAHTFGYHDYSTGFRCCKDAAAP